MGEYRSIDEVMGGRDIEPQANQNDAGTGGLTTADMAGAGTQHVTATAPEAVDTSSDLGTTPPPAQSQREAAPATSTPGAQAAGASPAAASAPSTASAAAGAVTGD